MDEESSAGEALLSTLQRIPIANLDPSFPSVAKGLVNAVVTIIWPYSSSTKSLTVLLAEPDFRLRRNKGQVRVQFVESSARHVSKAGIGSGDEVTLSLEGVTFVKDDSTVQTRGRGIEWELKFSERLLLKIKENETQKLSIVDIDHPPPEPDILPVSRVLSPEPVTKQPSNPIHPTRPQLSTLETIEWSSPAFVKRARLSYGSLLGNGDDIFADEDGTIPGVGRKRTRFSRASSSWRYSSRSPSPEKVIRITTEDDFFKEGSRTPDHRPPMMDEGSQTVGLDNTGIPPEATDQLSALQPAEPDLTTKRGINYDLEAPVVWEQVTAIQQEQAEELPSPSPSFLAQLSSEDVNGTNVHDPTDIATGKNIHLPHSLHTISADAHTTRPLASEGLDQYEAQSSEELRPIGHHQNWQPHFVSQNDPHSSQIENMHTTKDIYGTTPPLPRNSLEEDPYHAGQTLESPHQYGRWQSFVAAHERLSRPVSPELYEAEVQAYPEPELHGHLSNVHQESGPYYDDYAKREVILDQEPHTDYPRVAELVEPADPLESKSHSAAASFPISRSQSAQSEPIDLTEESEGTEEGQEGVEKAGFSEDDDDDRDVSEAEEYEEDARQSCDEVDYEEEGEEDDGRYPPGFRPIYGQRESIEDEDQEDYSEDEGGVDEEEEETEYDDDVDNGEADASHVQPGGTIVIDLLSSDDEEQTTFIQEDKFIEKEELPREESSADEESLSAAEDQLEEVIGSAEEDSELDREESPADTDQVGEEVDENVVQKAGTGTGEMNNDQGSYADAQRRVDAQHRAEINDEGQRNVDLDPGTSPISREESARLRDTGDNELYPVLPIPEKSVVDGSAAQYDASVPEPLEVRQASNDQLPTPEATQFIAIGDRDLLNRDEGELVEGEGLASSENATAKPTVAPTTPTQTRRLLAQEEQLSIQSTSTISVLIDGPATPEEDDPSADIALTALESPSKLPEVPVSSPAVRAQLTRALRTNLGDFTPLKLLRFNLEKKLDVLGVATMQSSEAHRAKNGPRHFHIKFNVTDPSIAPAGIAEVHIFRPYKEALPTVQMGDGVLLRNFLVKAEKDHGFVLRSDDASSWVCFKKDGVSEVRGPPVEFGEGEEEHITNLKSWFGSLDNTALAKIRRANGEKSPTISRATATAF